MNINYTTKCFLNYFLSFVTFIFYFFKPCLKDGLEENTIHKKIISKVKEC